MMVGAKKTSVRVYDNRCEVYVQQKSKSVWIADGEYQGKSIAAQGSSQADALTKWRRYAERSDD